MNCIYCNTDLPEKGFFCPSCFKQVKCKHCNEALVKDAPICVFCGEEVGQKAIVSNVNTIEFSESETGRNFKASFTDTVGQSISDSFSLLLSNRIVPKSQPFISLPQNSGDESATPTTDKPTIPVAVNNDLEKFKEIFSGEGVNVTLIETRLKASSKRDYSIRLSVLFLYYKSLTGVAKVPRNELTAITENASVHDSNFRFWLANNALIGTDNGIVELKAAGRDLAKQVLIDISNASLKDGWNIGNQTRVGKKGGGKNGTSDENIGDSISEGRTKKKKSRSRGEGPLSWTKELLEEGFFDQPKSMRDVIEELANRSHNLKHNDVTNPLRALCHKKLLRRKKSSENEGGHYVWSKW